MINGKASFFFQFVSYQNDSDGDSQQQQCVSVVVRAYERTVHSRVYRLQASQFNFFHTWPDRETEI